MSEQKPCVRCERGIDSWARICPYCNWDQSRPAPVREIVPAPVAEYKPPQERSLKTKAWYGIVGSLLLVVAFGIGMLINRDGAPKHAPEPISEQQQDAPPGKIKRADTQLVPVNEPGGVEQPITSAPAAAAPGQPAAGSNEWDRSDATAVSAAEYAQLAKRAKAEKKKMAVLVDPRSLTGPAYAQAPVRPRPQQPAAPSALSGSQQPQPQPARRVAMRTRPVPQYQPVPRLRAHGRARLDLIIGADGRVHDINVRRSLSGDTAALIGAVQTWRFKPATENGEPVSAPYTVEISFQ